MDIDVENLENDELEDILSILETMKDELDKKEEGVNNENE